MPSEADYVIIGAGATGTALAYHLTLPNAPTSSQSVIVLEAKDVASCASGRNGGHVAPRSWNVLNTMIKPLSEGGAGLEREDAVDVYHFEMENLDYVEAVVRKEKLDADFWRGHRLEVFTTPEGAAKNEETLQRFMSAQEAGRHKGKKMECQVLRGEEAKKRARMDSATGVTLVPAGSWHPHRGVTGLMRRALEQGVKLFSWTPVMSLKQDGDWVVDCGDRGKIKAKNVVLATNGYTRYLTEGDLAKQYVPHRLSC